MGWSISWSRGHRRLARGSFSFLGGYTACTVSECMRALPLRQIREIQYSQKYTNMFARTGRDTVVPSHHIWA
jgi:hypothetical protein